MTLFLLAAAILALLSLSYATRPLWQSRPATGIAVLVALAVTAGLLYSQVGTPEAVDPARRRAPETLADAVAQLEAELQRRPDQPEGWRLLARAYASEGRLPEALSAYERAVTLAPDPDLLAEAAETRALADANRRFDARAVAMLEQALRLEPRHQRARWFLGIARRQAGQPAEAARIWEPLLAMVEPRTAVRLREQVDAARAEAGLAPLPAPAAVPASAGLKVSVALSPAMASRLPAGATLFVIARQPGGPPMPVAAEKLAATGFPLTVTLDDADSPMPTLKLSQVERVEVFARISASGDATAQAGDLAAEPQVVARDRQAPVALTIDRVVD